MIGRDWIDLKKENHSKTQKLFEERFNIDLKSKDMDCKCVMCLADFRTKLRESVYNECADIIEEAVKLRVSEIVK